MRLQCARATGLSRVSHRTSSTLDNHFRRHASQATARVQSAKVTARTTSAVSAQRVSTPGACQSPVTDAACRLILRLPRGEERSAQAGVQAPNGRSLNRRLRTRPRPHLQASYSTRPIVASELRARSSRNAIAWWVRHDRLHGGSLGSLAPMSMPSVPALS